jgi:hypothetical protein
MVNYSLPLYQNEAEVWDEKTCKSKANHVATDGLGTPYPFKGYIGSHYGDHRFNGGCIRDNEWWQGEHKPLPKIHKNYEIIVVPTWGSRIRKKGTE